MMKLQSSTLTALFPMPAALSLDGYEMDFQAIPAQDLNDVLAAARLCLSVKPTSTQSEMFRGLYGGLFVGSAKHFGEKLDAHKAHKHLIPEVLAELAAELFRRDDQSEIVNAMPIPTIGIG